MMQFSESLSINDETIVIDYIFFGENEDLFLNFNNSGFNINTELISLLSKNQFNNRIGFYQILLKTNHFLKIFIIPKTEINYNTYTKEELITLFNKYFKEYLRLRAKHKCHVGYENITDNIIDIDFSTINTLEDYLISRYKKALLEVISFFKKYCREEFLINQFSSQGIKANIDIRKNISEINKSNIHQLEYITTNKSFLANVTLNVTQYFSTKKHALMSDNDMSLDVKVLNKLLAKIIKNKFVDCKQFNSQQKIVKDLNSKKFLKKTSTKRLKNNLLLLTGWESQSNSIKITNVDSIWFSSEYMYELAVFDKLSKLESQSLITFDVKPSLKYQIMSELEVVSETSSNPDFIINYNNKNFVIDAKWKVIYNFNNISNGDVLKIFRDSHIFYPEQTNVSVILFYPKILIPLQSYYQKRLNYNYDVSNLFEILEIDLFDEDCLASYFT